MNYNFPLKPHELFSKELDLNMFIKKIFKYVFTKKNCNYQEYLTYLCIALLLVNLCLKVVQSVHT